MKKLLGFAAVSIPIMGVLLYTGSFSKLLSTNYLPHRYCYLAQPGLVWTNVTADALIAISYALLVGSLLWVVGKLRRMREVQPYLWIVLSFGAFIIACGATHAMEVLTVWLPAYPLSAAVKVLCAAVSVPTATLFVKAAPALAASIAGFLETLSTAQQDKDQALLDRAEAEKQAENVRISAAIALAKASERFQLLVEGLNEHALFTIDISGCVTSWNRGAERLLGYTEAEIVGRDFSCMFTPEDIEVGVPEIHMNKARQAGKAEDEGWRIRANGERFWADINKTALVEDAGPVRGFAVIMRDVTERKNAAAALEEAHRERHRLQEKFLSHVSHELRTPLTAIYFFTTNVLDGLLGNLTPEQHEQLSLVVENVEQLKIMVSDLIDITRVETHKLVVEPQAISSVKLIAEVLNTCRTNAALKNIRLTSELTSDLPLLWADPVRVRQIFINLVDNAIKFTPAGGAVTVNGRACAEDNGLLCLSVTDTGCGISPENLEIVFDRLTQIKINDAEASRNGLGLGLFIARELVLRQGGRIWLESQLDHGSTFSFTLPVISLEKLWDQIEDVTARIEQLVQENLVKEK
jgi:PAS domain S-box-containing protein